MWGAVSLLVNVLYQRISRVKNATRNKNAPLYIRSVLTYMRVQQHTVYTAIVFYVHHVTFIDQPCPPVSLYAARTKPISRVEGTASSWWPRHEMDGSGRTIPLFEATRSLRSGGFLCRGVRAEALPGAPLTTVACAVVVAVMLRGESGELARAGPTAAGAALSPFGLLLACLTFS